MKQIIIIFSIALLAVSGCKKKDDPVTPVITPKVHGLKVTVENVVDGKPLVLKTGNYINAHGDSFTVTAYKYYISNISFFKEDGTAVKETESYHFINEEEKATKSFDISSLPAGRYTKMRFLIGVDSLRNVSGAQTGALDPSTGMHWDWNTGFIMAKLEGKSPQSDSKYLTFHIGGFSGPYSSLRWVTLQLPEIIETQDGKAINIHLLSDVAEWFKNPEQIDFSQTALLMQSGAGASKIADNYADMFSIAHIDQ